MRLIRHPDLLFCWSGRTLVVQNAEGGARLVADRRLASLLEAFGRPRAAREAAKAAGLPDARAAAEGVALLRRLRFLIPERAARPRRSRLRAWRHNLASAFYHAATRDMPFRTDVEFDRTYVREHVITKPRPGIFKRYRVPSRSKLAPMVLGGADLEGTLLARRTVREFSRRPVPFAELSRVLRGTWAWTGVFAGGPVAPLLAKTSPSGGGLHPGECYVLAWNVDGLAPGLYHYDIASDELRRLKRGDFRTHAVRAASGQKWVGQAAFLCVMTAVFARTLWKYQGENAYRTVWLDAGHLAQTFCLLATSRGLGPFTTAAIQDSYIEKLIGLDGVREFPVYLCGAGMPAPRSRRRIVGE